MNARDGGRQDDVYHGLPPRRAEERHEKREADVAVDDGRDGDVEVNGRAHDALDGHGRELRKENRAEEAEGRTDEDGEQRRLEAAEDERQRAEMLRARVPRRLVKNSTGLTSARVKSPCLPTKKIIEKIISVMRQADAMKRQRPHLS